MEARPAQKNLEQEQRQRRHAKQDQQDQRQHEREKYAAFRRARNPGGEEDEADKDQYRRANLRDVVLKFPHHARKEWIVVCLDRASQDQDRPNAADVEQRRQREQQRRYQAGADADGDGARIDAEVRRNVQQLRQKQRERKLHADAEQDSEHTSAQSQQQRLQHVNFHHLPRARAERFHDRNAVEPLLQVRAHGHRNTHRAQHKRDQGHQREQAGGRVQAARNRRAGFAVIRDLRLGQQRLKARF